MVAKLGSHNNKTEIKQQNVLTGQKAIVMCVRFHRALPRATKRFKAQTETLFLVEWRPSSGLRGRLADIFPNNVQSADMASTDWPTWRVGERLKGWWPKNSPLIVA